MASRPVAAIGAFVRPTAHREFEDLGSPIGAFLRDCCEVGPDYHAPQRQVFDAWRRWCARNGRRRRAGPHRHGFHRGLELPDRWRPLRSHSPDDAGATGAAGKAEPAADRGCGRAHPERQQFSGGHDRASRGDRIAECWLVPLDPAAFDAMERRDRGDRRETRLCVLCMLRSTSWTLVLAAGTAAAARRGSPPTFNREWRVFYGGAWAVIVRARLRRCR